MNENKCLTLVPVKWASESDIINLRGIIYRITCLINGKNYIGYSLRTLSERYAITWWKSIDNIYLNNAINKYGYLNFKVEILISNYHNESSLLFMESFFASYYRSYYYQHGYNIAECGKGATSKPYFQGLIKSPSGKIFEIYRLRNFCKQNNLSRWFLARVLKGKQISHKGWTLPQTTKEQASIPQWVSTASRITYINPFGHPQTIFNVRKFCRENDLSRVQMRDLVTGKQKRHKGWTYDHRIDLEFQNKNSTPVGFSS